MGTISGAPGDRHLLLHRSVLEAVGDLAVPPLQFLKAWPVRPADRHLGLTYAGDGFAVDFYFDIGGEHINLGPSRWTGSLVPLDYAHYVFGLVDMASQRAMNQATEAIAPEALYRFSSMAGRLADPTLLRAVATSSLTEPEAEERWSAFQQWTFDRLEAEYRDK